jgi:hypothetical protein
LYRWTLTPFTAVCCLAAYQLYWKYEFYNRGDIINIQQLIENIIADLKIDISATGHE